MTRATRSPGPTTFSMPSAFANCRRVHCAPTPMTCCTSLVGLQEPVQPLSEITESTLLDYVRHQLDQQPKPTPQTVNHRLARDALLVSIPLRPRDSGRPVPFPAHLHDAIPARLWPTSPRHRLRSAAPSNPTAWSSRSRPQRSHGSGQSFRTFRDLAVVGLMLLDGLRSCEILALQVEDLELADAQVRVSGQRKQEARLAVAPARSSKSSISICGWKGRSPTPRSCLCP